jgi:hypothetical protein
MKKFLEQLEESISKDLITRARYLGKKAYGNRIENNPKKDVVFIHGFLNGVEDKKLHARLEKEYRIGYTDAKNQEDSAKIKSSDKAKEALKNAQLRRELEKKEKERQEAENKKMEKNPYYTKKITTDMQNVTCDKCGGKGYIEQFKFNKMGECFKCKTKGYIAMRVKKVEWVFDQKKYDKDHPEADWWEGLMT